MIAGVMAGFVGSELKKRVISAYESLRHKQEIEDMFGEHVSPEVVTMLLSEEGQKSRQMELTMLFLDVRGFTTFSEKLPPDQVYDALNQMFDFMIEIIRDYKGIINKFLGDGFMAVFGAPLADTNHAANAIAASRQIVQALADKIKEGKSPDLNIGIGLHSGTALTVNVGSAQRKEYTIIGDVVNLASRIESLNKEFQSTLLISEETRDLAVESEGKKIGAVKVKGRQEPVTVYQLI